VLSADEVRWLWLATAEPTPFHCIIRTLLLTGQRRLEVSDMPRKELDLKRRVWTIPAARTKNKREHAVPLAQQVIDVIQAAPVVGRQWVFTLNGDAPINGWSKEKDRLAARMLAMARQEATEAGLDPESVELEHWTIHDLRRTCASGMASLRQPIHVVEAVLNHASGAVSGIARVYNRFSYGDEKREALEAWANYVTSLVVPNDNVVAMRSLGR
jgi:integrase